MNLETFARNLRHLRKEKKMSQNDLGKVLFASVSLIKLIETERAKPSLDLAVRACEFFQIGLDDMTKTDLSKRA